MAAPDEDFSESNDIFQSDESIEIAMLELATALDNDNNGGGGGGINNAATVAAAARLMAGNTRTTSSSQNFTFLMENMHKMWKSRDWAPDLTLHESVNVADVFKTSNENKKMLLAQQHQHEELARALFNAVPPIARYVRAAVETICRTAAASPANHFAEFMKDMETACTPSTSTTTNTIMMLSPLSGTESETEITVSGTCSSSSSSLENPLAGTSSKKKKSRKRKQPDRAKPPKDDVICGRGPEANRHNSHFIAMCEARADDYSATNKRGKADGTKLAIVMEIINTIHDHGGRFIVENEATHQWQVLSERDAIIKTSHCIRDIVKKRRKKRKIEQQQQQEPTA